MLIIPVKEGENIDKALKRYKRKFDRTKTMRSLRERKTFTKPSVAKRAQKIKASYIQRLRTQEEIGQKLKGYTDKAPFKWCFFFIFPLTNGKRL